MPSKPFPTANRMECHNEAGTLHLVLPAGLLTVQIYKTFKQVWKQHFWIVLRTKTKLCEFQFYTGHSESTSYFKHFLQLCFVAASI